MNFKKIAREIFDNKRQGLLNASLLDFYATSLLEAMFKGHDTNLKASQLIPKDKALLETLAGNVYLFSGAKTWQELNEYNQILKTEEGKLKSWSAFYKEAKQINKTYSIHYLQTEYQHAVNCSQMIKRWNEFYAEKDILPYLIYEAVMDDKTRDEHGKLNGIKRHIDDPFWNIHFAPNGFNCRCDILQSAEASIDELNAPIPEVDIPKPFRNNPAKTKQIYSDEMPYFKHLPEEVKKDLTLKNLSLILPQDKFLKRLSEAPKN